MLSLRNGARLAVSCDDDGSEDVDGNDGMRLTIAALMLMILMMNTSIFDSIETLYHVSP